MYLYMYQSTRARDYILDSLCRIKFVILQFKYSTAEHGTTRHVAWCAVPRHATFSGKRGTTWHVACHAWRRNFHSCHAMPGFRFDVACPVPGGNVAWRGVPRPIGHQKNGQGHHWFFEMRGFGRGIDFRTQFLMDFASKELEGRTKGCLGRIERKQKKKKQILFSAFV